jgi:hypothetical protein
VSVGAVDPSDAALLARFEPVIRFNEGEYFLPASIESFVARAELWERTGPSSRELVVSAGSLDVDQLVALTDGRLAGHYLRLVSEPLGSAERLKWQLRRDRPRFRAETRLGRVGVLTRLVDAGARLSLVLRGRTPRYAEAAAALLDRDRPDHGEHPYYGRVVREAGYTVLQYWYFYFFNDWRSRAYGVNDHEADWEQVTIYLTDPGDGSLEPAWVAFSAHDEVGPDLRRRWDDPDLQFVGEHPIVFAGLGSHAGAVMPGEYLITVRSSRFERITGLARRVARFFQPWLADDGHTGLGIPYVEYARGDGVAIGPGTSLSWRQVVIDDETPWVRRYTGLWGDDTNDPFGGERGPAGPRYQRDATVRRSWSDPVGWAALDSVVPNDHERRSVIETRIAALADELAAIEHRRAEARSRLRAGEIAEITELEPGRLELARLSAESTMLRDERERLEHARDRGAVATHPHAHLLHRATPLPTESSDRRPLLRVWAAISTPLVFVLLAALFMPIGPSVIGLVVVGLVLILAIEALTRGRLVQFALRIVLLLVLLAVLAVVVAGLITSWRITLAVVLLAIAVLFLVLNVRELRRS